MKRIFNFFYINYKLGVVFGGKNLVSEVFLFTQFCLCIVWWKLFGKKIFELHLVFRGMEFVICADDRMDLAVLKEIFLNLEYDFPYEENPETIIDLGANIGDTAIFYSIIFPEAKIYSIEPNPFIFEKLKKNTEKFPNISCDMCAIGLVNGEIELNLSDSHLGSSLRKRDSSTNVVKVKSFTFDEFLFQKKIGRVDILKFDIEGAEEELLESQSIKKVKSIAGEIHEDLTTLAINGLIEKLQLENQIKKVISTKRYILFGNHKIN